MSDGTLIKTTLHIYNLKQIAEVIISIGIQFAFYLGYLIIELEFLSVS